MIYTIRKVYKYTETVEGIEAGSEREAKDIAERMEGELNHDDWLYDCEVVESRESEEAE